MEGVSMQHLFLSNGKVNLFGWILFLGTLTLIAYSIWHNIVSINKIKRDEVKQIKKMTELEMNLRKVRGTQYEELS